MKTIKPTFEELIKEQISFYQKAVNSNTENLKEAEEYKNLKASELKEIRKETQLNNACLKRRIELLNRIYSVKEEPINFTIKTISHKEVVKEQINFYQKKVNKLFDKVIYSNIEETPIKVFSYKDLIREQISFYQETINKNIGHLKLKESLQSIKADADFDLTGTKKELKEIRKTIQLYNACLKRRIELLNRVYSKLN